MASAVVDLLLFFTSLIGLIGKVDAELSRSE